jgi:hypothetical protein
MNERNHIMCPRCRHLGSITCDGISTNMASCGESIVLSWSESGDFIDNFVEVPFTLPSVLTVLEKRPFWWPAFVQAWRIREMGSVRFLVGERSPIFLRK